MKFTLAFLSNVLFASTAFAGLAERRAARARLRKTDPLARIGTPTVSGIDAENKSEVSYSSNWAGAVLTAPPAGSTFTAVSAQFIVPTPTGSGAASAWVGIDGDTYANAILQTGVDFYVQNGVVSYDCWYEWFPDYAYDFTGIPIKAGDLMTISVASTSNRAGKVTITNETTKKTVTKSLTPPTAQALLGGQNAEWIVEDFSQGGSLVEFVNFNSVTFTDAIATTSKGVTLTPATAELIDIKQGGTVFTTSSVSGNSVTIKHN